MVEDFTHIQSVAHPLKGPGVRHRGVSRHTVGKRLLPLTALPGLHHGGALPVHILQGAPKTRQRKTQCSFLLLGNMFVFFSFVFPLSNVLVSSSVILNTEHISATIKVFVNFFSPMLIFC